MLKMREKTKPKFKGTPSQITFAGCFIVQGSSEKIEFVRKIIPKLKEEAEAS